MVNIQALQQYKQRVLYLLAFTIPLPFIYSTLAIILLTCISVVEMVMTKDYRRVVRNIRSGWLWLGWIAFFALHALSYLYSEDKGQSAFDLESKLSFLVLPVVIGCGIRLDADVLRNSFLGFILGIVTVALFCLTQALVLYAQSGNLQVFFYHALVRGLEANAVYLAWYVVVALALVLFFPWRQTAIIGRPLMRYSLMLFLFIFLLLLSARMLLAVFILFIIPYYFIRTGSGRNQWGIALLLLALAASAIIVPNPIAKRYKELISIKATSPFQSDYSGSDPQFTNFTLRLFLWRVGFDNIRDHNLWLTGAGNGDVSKLQNQRIADLGINGMLGPKADSNLRNVNLHNMFIQSLIMLGIPGLLLFLWLMLAPLVRLGSDAISPIILIFYVVAILFMCQESALQTQAGIVFFLVFYSLLMGYRYQQKELAVNKL